MKVLIIDDEDMIREIARMSLAMGGIALLDADDGPTGVALAASELPDAILLDLQMPGMDGLATFDALRARPDTATIPVVFLSASAERKPELLARGARGMLLKPFDPMSLAHDLRRMLDGD